MARNAGAELRVVSAWPSDADQDEIFVMRAGLREQIAAFPGATDAFDLDLSIRMRRAAPVDAILGEAARFHPDLIILGSHGDPRLRDVLFGTTAMKVAREANHPVLIVQTDHTRPYEKLLVAIDDCAAKQVLRLALGIGTAKDIHVVHVGGSVGESLFGGGETLERVRADQEVLTGEVADLVRTFGLSSATPRIHQVVEDGDAIDVIMRSWATLKPDLLIMGTAGRGGLARVFRESHAKTVILGCPSDILIARTHIDG